MSNLTTIKSFPKVNLGLNVYPKERGMDKHRIMSIFLLVEDFYDIIEIEEAETTMINFYDEHGKYLDIAPDTCLAVLKFLKIRKSLDKNFKISIFKKIPMHAGLGGSSSNAGAILKYLCDTYNIEIDLEDLFYIAVNVSSDLPFFASGMKLAFVTGYGDEVYDLSYLKAPSVELFPFYWDVPTKVIFKQFDNTLLNMPKNDYKQIISNWDQITTTKLTNDLLVPALSISKEYHNYFQVLNNEYNNDIMMTGAGSFFFKFKTIDEDELIDEELVAETYKDFNL